MKKFGFGKKDKSGDDKKNAAASNPYAQQPAAASDPYAQPSPAAASPYQQARQQQYGGSPAGPGAGRGLPSGPGAMNRAPPSTAGSVASGFGAEKYGSGGGYGSNRYGDSPDGPPDYTSQAGSIRGAGGYGGMGGRRGSNETTNTEDNRNALFGGAKERVQQQQTSLSPANGSGGGYGEESAPGSHGGGYGEERQLTAEEEEEEEVANTKSQIRTLKREDVSSTRNALRIAAMAEESGRGTLARLGAQGERIHNTEKNLDLAANHNRIAEEKAKELKTLNKSMFAVHVSNPFTTSSRKAARDEDIMNKHRTEREQRDATRQAAFGTQQRMEQSFRDLQPGDPGFRGAQTKASLAERSKYQFEADSEDEEMENEIDSNIDALGHAAGRLNALARATGKEVDEQNKHIDRIIQKSDRVDDQIAMNRARLDRIR